MRIATNFGQGGLYDLYKPRWSGVPAGSAGLEASEGQGDAQGEGVAAVGGGQAGQLGDAAQPVPDGVGVDEQQPRGRLQRRPLFEVGGERVEERGAGGGIGL